MSNVADAIDRSALASRGTSLRDDDHPWGDDLQGRPADVPDLEDRNPFEPLHSVPPPPRIEPSTATRQAQQSSQALAAPPAIAMDEVQRAQVAALVQRLFLPVTGEAPQSVAFSGVDAASGLITAAAGEM